MKKWILSVMFLFLSSPAFSAVDWTMKFEHPDGVSPAGKCGLYAVKLTNLSTAGESVSFDYATAYGTSSEEVVPGNYASISVKPGKTEILEFKLTENQRVYARFSDPTGGWSSGDSFFDESCIDCSSLSLNDLEDIARAIDICDLDMEDIEITGIQAKFSVKTKQ